MAAKILTFGIQKGGSSKTTTVGVVAWLLAQEYGYRVLCVDFDSQGNLTELLTGNDIYEYRGRTVFEAVQEEVGEGYIHPITETLNIMTADDHLATFGRYLRKFEKIPGHEFLTLKRTLDTVSHLYDFILIDTPPALSEQTQNALCASDYVVMMLEASKFCYNALSRFKETVDSAQALVNPDLKIAGILRTLIDARRSDNKALIDLAAEEYPQYVFETVITRKASTGRLPLEGFLQNPELRQAIVSYKPFVEELLRRVQ